ncbi:MAG: Nif3-like dinuclear metal center hexameric protein [Candidatus Eremiobacteraeota bacterium]|nr:Nif3-like dinuclear metal center hexameric protein [Candidatus Eremiobacteraeota bacterium]
MKRAALAEYLDEFLRVREIDDFSANGLQIEGRDEVESLALAVDFSLQSAEKAGEAGADMLIVHHGLIWGGLKSITGMVYRRVKLMIDAGISLYCAHLPLDMHPLVGNNAQLCDLLSLSRSGTFGSGKAPDLGMWGILGTPQERTSLKDFIDRTLMTESTLLPFGAPVVRSVAIVSGGGASHFQEALEKKVDLFITGEPSHTIYHMAKEEGVNVLYGGHYATETLGVRALGSHLSGKFPLRITWLDVPTGL